jgi:GNAT superfamily N-acetyltransferase
VSTELVCGQVPVASNPIVSAMECVGTCKLRARDQPNATRLLNAQLLKTERAPSAVLQDAAAAAHRPSRVMIIRDPLPEDEASWRRLWSGYNAFYNAAVPEVVTRVTWRRILDPHSAIFARLAENHDDIIGFTISVLHEGTWTTEPICYLEDLFVEPGSRRQGAGRLLIQDLVDRGRDRRWSRLYWHTRTDNPARALYDQFAAADDFVRYRLMLDQ